MKLTQQQIRQIIKEEIQNVFEEEAEQSDGGTILTGKEIEQIPKKLNLKTEFDKVAQEFIADIEKNKEKLKQLRDQKDSKAINEVIFTSTLGVLGGTAMLISLMQIAAKTAVYIKSFGGTATYDPDNPYFNDTHKKIDKFAEYVKRALIGGKLYVAIVGVLKFWHRNDNAAYEKALSYVNLIMDAIAIMMTLNGIYQNWETIKTAVSKTDFLQKAFTESGKVSLAGWEAWSTAFDNSAGLKDFIKSLVKIKQGTFA